MAPRRKLSILPWLSLTISVAIHADDRLGPELGPAPASGPHVVTADAWAQPRSGERIAALPAMRAIVTEYDRAGGHAILIRYPGGDSGTLMAHELKDWLVALGIPGSDVRLQKGLDRADVLILEITGKDHP